MSEFYYDYLTRVTGRPPNILDMKGSKTYFNTNDPDGSCADSWGRYQTIYDPYTKLRKCGVCGERKTPKKCHERTWISPEYLGKKFGVRDIWKVQGRGYICLSCWNKQRHLEAVHWQAIENKSLMNKLYKTILEKKNEKIR